MLGHPLALMAEASRPSFDNPPVVEVVCAIEFLTLGGMQAPHFGLFWSSIKDRFPRCVSAIPLGTPQPDGSFLVDLGQFPPLPRLQFHSESGDALVQMQTDRFIFNWKRVDAQAPYPRFPNVLQQFQELFARFTEFCAVEKIGEIQPTQLEVTYVNHIPVGVGWESFAEVGRVLPDVAWRTDARYLPSAAGFTWRTRFNMDGGALHVTAQSATRTTEPAGQLLRLDLTARGSCAGKSLDDVWVLFAKANEWIVKGFIDVTSPEMQQTIWRRTA